ncbi:S8 family serine peptidase [Shewanella maritima]|uniref:S8 family serine peptidase n=1 Tax=Shewanella maritima TaxID=2520507 RepID=UPI003735E739
MKLKKLSLMTAAALYSVASGIVVASAPQDYNMRSIEITDAILKLNEDLYNNRNRNGTDQINNNSHKTNVHRAIAQASSEKVPFQFNQDISGTQTYIIELADTPVSLYRGGINQLAATSPSMSTVPAMLSPGQHNKLNLNSNAVIQYNQYLKQKQDNIISQVDSLTAGQSELLHRYSLAFNGMSMRMTQEEAQRVAALAGVRNVTLEKVYQLHTDTGPKHIGADGMWLGNTSDEAYKGEGIVIGVLDTGVNTDHPSFAEVGGDGYVHTMPSRYDNYLGDCEKEAFASMCNDKLIGVRSYEVITDTYSDPVFQPEIPSWQVKEPKRPANGEDYNGHGSHTASTAAGNVLKNIDYVVPLPGEMGDGVPTGLVFAEVSGVAPHANIIMYQVCHQGDGSYGETFGGCPGSALLAGIEDAIADGVDVINYSIGSTFGSFPWEDPMELGFLAAREAGISVAASAGNSYNPEYASQARGAIDHLSPWLTSVAASTHGRAISVEGKMVSNSSGGEQDLVAMSGGGITGEYTGPVVEAAAYGSEYQMCNEPFEAGFFDMMPDGVTPFDKAPIVVCQRGEIARVAKADNVMAGGAGGFILYNTDRNDTVNNDPFAIPGIHLDYNSYYGHYTLNENYGLQDWLAQGSNHVLTITASEVVVKADLADYVADFSSRGPNFEAPDVMSPNLAAPGVNVFAAWADEMPFSAFGLPADYAAISGTSMAAPHVAGSMALLTQSHPDWTPAQIQSALMTTASIDGVTRSRDRHPYDPVAAGYSDAGSGVINVSRANNAGLLLDETASNYRAANPKNGGNIHTLNLPYFYNDNCETQCSWMRVVTATQDGTWNVEALTNEMQGADMLHLEVSPKTFTLKAGESQAISLTANILEVEAIGADTSQIQLFGDVVITPESETMPLQHLPVGVRYAPDNLPKEVKGIIHRQQGHTLTPAFQADEFLELNASTVGLVKGQFYNFNLQGALVRDYSSGLTVEDIQNDPGAEIIFFEVPEGTQRVVWEVVSADPQHTYTSLDLGMDVNNDNELQWNDEAICYSYTDAGDYCAINNPMPGRYWAIAANWKWLSEDPKDNADPFKMSLAIVADTDEANLSVEGPTSSDGLEPVQLKLNYDIKDAQEGDIYYGVMSLGSDAYNADNLGSFAVKLSHQGNDTHIESSQTAAQAGDIVDFTVTLAPNLLAGEREFSINTELSAGLQIIEDSITLGGISDFGDGATIAGNVINLNGVQASSADMPRHYVFTTNLEDATCRVPYGDDPTFYDVGATGADHLGISGHPRNAIYLPMEQNGLPHVPLYGNAKEYSRDFLGISPFGFVQFDPMPLFFNQHTAFDEHFQAFPDTIVAPLWRGDVGMPEAYFDFATLQWKNAVYGVITDNHYIFQWNGGQELANWLVGNNNPDPNAEFNIQTVIATQLDFAPETPEIVFAYKTLKSANDHFGSIGLHGFWGERGYYGPVYGYLNDGFAFNDVDEKVTEGMVVCADYRGPEQTEVKISFSARVSNEAAGSESMVKVDSQYADSEMITVEHKLSTPTNISVAAMADMTMAENSTLEGLVVIYNDLKNTSNTISVTGAHISAMIEGHTSGSQFSITSEQDWYGTTEVTVTVSDMAYPSDASSTSFMLTVNSDGIEPVTPEAPAEETVTEDSDSGGSLGWLALMMLGLVGAARRKH